MQEVRYVEMAKRFVTCYTVEKVYGGAEEGGWYYPVTTCQYSVPCKSKEKAKKMQAKRTEEARQYNDSAEYDYFVIESRQHCGRDDDTNKPAPHYC